MDKSSAQRSTVEFQCSISKIPLNTLVQENDLASNLGNEKTNLLFLTMSRYFSTEKSMIMLNILLSFPYNSIIYKKQQSLKDTFYTLIFLLLIPQHLWPLNFKAQFSQDVTQPATIFSPSLKVHVFTNFPTPFLHLQHLRVWALIF